MAKHRARVDAGNMVDLLPCQGERTDAAVADNCRRSEGPKVKGRSAVDPMQE